MLVTFYETVSGRIPVKEFIEKLRVADRARVLGCLKSIEELGLETSRVEFRQIRGKLWEVKIKTENAGLRIFYVVLKDETMVLLHIYKKQSQKAPGKEVQIAEKRMMEVLNNESNYFR